MSEPFVPDIGDLVIYRDASGAEFQAEVLGPQTVLGVKEGSVLLPRVYGPETVPGQNPLDPTPTVFDNAPDPADRRTARRAAASKRAQDLRWEGQQILYQPEHEQNGWVIEPSPTVNTFKCSAQNRTQVIRHIQSTVVKSVSVDFFGDLGTILTLQCRRIRQSGGSQLEVTVGPVSSPPHPGPPGNWIPLEVVFGDSTPDDPDIATIYEISISTGNQALPKDWLHRNLRTQGFPNP